MMMQLLGHKVIQAGLQSGTVMTFADLATQCFIEKETESMDWQRTLRWSLAGLCIHGPYFYLGFARLDSLYGAATHWSIVAKKTVTAQLVLFPPYLSILFSFMSIAEGQRNLSKVVERVQIKVPSAFIGGSFFWPVANAINFAFVSQAFRMPYLCMCGALWNSYLSWTNAKGNKKKAS